MKKCCRENIQKSFEDTWYCNVCKTTYYSDTEGARFIEQIEFWKKEAQRYKTCLDKLRKDLGL